MKRHLQRILAAFLLFASSAYALASDPPQAELKLFVPGTLRGWERGVTVEGWRATAEGLIGGEGASALSSDFAFDDARIEAHLEFPFLGALQFDWMLRDDSSRISLHITSSSMQWIVDSMVVEEVLTAGLHPEIDLVIEHRGSRWVARHQQGPAIECDVPSSTGVRYALGLAVSGTGATIKHLRASEALGSRIDAEALARWTCDGNRAAWSQVDDELQLKPGNGRYLQSDQLYSNFVLSFDYRMPANANSGVSLRTPAGGWPSTDGMELQLMHAGENAPLDEHAAAAIYGNLSPVARDVKVDDWNAVVIAVEGSTLRAWWNGTLVQVADLARHPELRYRPERGWIGFQDHGAVLRVRDLRLRALQGGDPMPPSTRPLSCAERVLGPVIESVSLAETMGNAARAHDPAITVLRPKLSASKQGEELCLIEGPGVLLSLSGLAPRTRIAIERDQEGTPLWTGSIAALARSTFAWSADSNPLLVAVPFVQSLRISTLDHHPVIEAEVVFARALDASAEELAAARGYLEVARYRRTQHKDGRIRRLAPLQEKHSERRSLAADERVSIEFEGRGVLPWLRVEAPAAAFESTDLWICATSDERATPDVLVPLRYFFPAHAAELGATSLIELGGEHATARWALPYRNGIRMELWNRGVETSPELRLSAATQQLSEHEVLPPARLVARYVSKENASELKLDGRGAILRITSSIPARIPQLCDGVEHTGWIPPGSVGGGSSHGLAWRNYALDPPRFERQWMANREVPAAQCVIAYVAVDSSTPK